MAIIFNQGQQVGEALGQIGQGLGGFIQQVNDPDRELRQRMQLLLASNPALAQQFANMEAVTPGSAQNMLGRSPRFFGGDQYNNILQSIRNTGPDALTQERINIEQADKQLQQQEQQQVMQGAMDATNPLLESFNATIQDRAVEPTKPAKETPKPELEAKDFLRWRKQQLTSGRIGTLAEYEREKMQDALLQDKVRASVFDRKKRERLEPLIQGLPKRNITQDVSDFLRGKLDNEVGEAYMYSDEYKDLWSAIMRQKMQDDSQEAKFMQAQLRQTGAQIKLQLIEQLQRSQGLMQRQIDDELGVYNERVKALGALGQVTKEGQKEIEGLKKSLDERVNPVRAQLGIIQNQISRIQDALIEVDGFKSTDVERTMKLKEAGVPVESMITGLRTNPNDPKILQAFQMFKGMGVIDDSSINMIKSIARTKRKDFTGTPTPAKKESEVITEAFKNTAKPRPKAMEGEAILNLPRAKP